jgi:hypothetical protein
MPGKAALNTEIRTYRIRTISGDQPSHSAKPPQTPAIILLRDFVKAICYLPLLFFEIYGNQIKNAIALSIKML